MFNIHMRQCISNVAKICKIFIRLYQYSICIVLNKLWIENFWWTNYYYIYIYEKTYLTVTIHEDVIKEKEKSTNNITYGFFGKYITYGLGP